MISIFSPDAHSHPVNLIEERLGLFDAAIVVPFEPTPNTRERFCFHNVRDVIADRGGEIVYGWLVWQHGDIFVEAELHAVWRKPTGELACVTPQTPSAITFIPDPSATYEFDRELITNNIRIALVNDSRVDDFFKACGEQTEILNGARRKSGLGPRVELPISEAMRHRELEMRKAALMSQVLQIAPMSQIVPSDSRWSRGGKVGRNGKKYKKCHGA